MGSAARIASLLSKILARLHHWYGAAWLLSHFPVASLDGNSVGRLRYALMMASRGSIVATQRLFDGILRRNRETSAEVRIEIAAMATAIGSNATAVDLLRQAAAVPVTEDVSGRLLHLLLRSEDGSLREELFGHLNALDLPANSLLTLVPVSGHYLDLWQFWLQQVQKHVGGSVVAMAMDDQALHALSGTSGVFAVDVRNYFSWSPAGHLHPHTRGVLWYLRTVILRLLVQRDHSVLVLDLDAVPVANLQPLLQDLSEACVIAQQDHSIPMDVDRKLGFVLCCGFMLWRPTAASQVLLERFEKEAARERDDQLALNHLLCRQGIEPRVCDDIAMRFTSDKTHFACPDVSLVSRSLHTGTVVRHFHQEGKSVAEIRDALGLQSS